MDSHIEFKRKIDSARNILVGAVPSPAGQIDQITYALIYKFMSDIDDKSARLPGGTRQYFVDEYEKYDWHNLMRLDGQDKLNRYRDALSAMSKNKHLPEIFRSIYQNAFLPYNDPRTLNLFLKEIDGFVHTKSDAIGDAYEYLLSITGAQGDVGQFRTPRHIIKFIVDVVQPGKDDTVLDPACGTAGFLIAAYNYVRMQYDGVGEDGEQNGEQRLTADERKKLHGNYYGYDIDPTMVRTATVNMYLHGFSTPNIEIHDTLTSEEHWQNRYDVILANPPFMTPKGGIQPHGKFGVKANRAEVLFVDYIASHLKPNGRAGIVVPEGIIFQSGKAYKELRKNLVENYLYAVVSLPAGVFQPYSGVKTSVLLFDKELAKQRDEILFVKVENDGYSLGAQRRKITGDQFPEALEVIEKFKTGEELAADFAHTVLRSEIAESGDYNLSGDRYKTAELHGNHNWDVVELGDVVEVMDRLRKPITKSDRKSGKYPYYGATGVLDYIDNFIFNERLVLLGEDGAKWGPGERSSFIADGEYWVNNHAHVLKPIDNKIIDSYLVNLLNEMDLLPYITGVTVPKLNQEKMRGIKIPLPPIEIQREIVAELDGYQKIIDAAQTIVQSYKPTIKINPEWERAKIGDVAKLMTGGTPSRSVDEFWSNGTIPWLVSGDIHKGLIRECDGRITELALKNSNARILPRDSVMIALNGQGKTRATVALLAGEGFTCNQSLVAITPVKERLDAGFLYYQMKGMYQEIRAINGDNQRGGLNMPLIRNLNILVPPIEVQREIVAELEAEQKLINANKKLIEVYQQKIKSKIAEVWGE